MATRNLSLEYAELRSAHRSNYPRGSEGVQPPPDASTSSTSITVGESPPWVQYKETIRRDVEQLKEDLHLLQNLHTARLRINFDPDSVQAQDQEIERVVDKITATLRRCEGNIKRIAMAGGDPRKLQQQERQVMMNAMRAMAIELNTQSKTFRHAQKQFLDSHTTSTHTHAHLSTHQCRGTLFPFASPSGGALCVSDLRQQQAEEAAEAGTASAGREVRQLDSMVDTIMDPNQSLNAEQQQQLETIEVESQDRMKEIVRVAQSINELASLFRELNVLVIEQGTILDRIDYNVEQTVAKVKQGVTDLDKADDISKRAVTAKCIGALIVVVAILLLALIIKWSAQAS